MIKSYNIITIILIAYIAIIAYWARDLIIIYNNYLEFFLLIGVTLIAILLLRYTIKCRDRKNNEEE